MQREPLGRAELVVLYAISLYASPLDKSSRDCIHDYCPSENRGFMWLWKARDTTSVNFTLLVNKRSAVIRFKSSTSQKYRTFPRSIRARAASGYIVRIHQMSIHSGIIRECHEFNFDVRLDGVEN